MRVVRLQPHAEPATGADTVEMAISITGTDAVVRIMGKEDAISFVRSKVLWALDEFAMCVRQGSLETRREIDVDGREVIHLVKIPHSSIRSQNETSAAGKGGARSASKEESPGDRRDLSRSRK